MKVLGSGKGGGRTPSGLASAPPAAERNRQRNLARLRRIAVPQHQLPEPELHLGHGPAQGLVDSHRGPSDLKAVGDIAPHGFAIPDLRRDSSIHWHNCQRLR